MKLLLIPALLLVAMLTACGGGESPELSEARFVFEVEPAVEEGDRAIIERVLAQVRTYFAGQTGRDIQHDVAVRIKTGDPLTGKTAYGTFGAIDFYVSGPAWTPFRYKDAERSNAALIAHEYFHTLQWDLVVGEGSPNRQFSIPAAWLLEGSAELAAYRFTEQAGYTTMQNAIDYYGAFIAGTPQPRLGTVVVNSQANYAQAFLAVEQLRREHDLRRFAAFFADTGTMTWRDAFAKNFGLAVDAFIDGLDAETGVSGP